MKKILVLLFVLFPFFTFPQLQSIKVTKISGGFVFDGIPDEPFWQTIKSLPMVMLVPNAGEPASEETICKIAYDGQYLYVSGILKYTDITDMRPVSKKRDYDELATDWFGVVMDTYNDRENAVTFFTNPNGIRTDVSVKNDALTLYASDVDFSWNTFWDVKTKINKYGWSAELRIPFSSLRFQSVQEKTIMGITLVRMNAGKSEIMTCPEVSPNFYHAFWKPSLSERFEFEGLHPEKILYVTPYVTGGIGQDYELNEKGTAYKINSTPKFDAGLDMKYSLTNNLTADLTINTDFAQVEADNQQINLTRFSLYFPEKRMFFLEKADVFDFSFVGNNYLFYSRRIGIYDGNPVRIYGGLRMTGKVGEWDVGFLDMQTAKIEVNPSENFGVARIKRKVINENSYIGGIITSRLGIDGSYNYAYGLDGQFRVTGDEYLTMRWAQTFENDMENKLLDMSPARLLFEWHRRNNTGFGYDLLYSWSGKSYNPGIGFEMKENYQGPRVILQYGTLTRKKTFLRYHKFSITQYNFWNTLTKDFETSFTSLHWEFEAKKGFGGYIEINQNIENLSEELTLGNEQATVPPGRYPFTNVSIYYYTGPSHHFSTWFTADVGQFFDGRKQSFHIYPTLNIGSDFSLGMNYEIDHINFPDRSMKFTNHIVALKGLMTLSTKTSLAAFIQYNTAINEVIGNIRFRFNPSEGNDFYIVYDEGLNTNRSREIPSLPFSTARTLLLKYTYTFRL